MSHRLLSYHKLSLFVYCLSLVFFFALLVYYYEDHYCSSYEEEDPPPVESVSLNNSGCCCKRNDVVVDLDKLLTVLFSDNVSTKVDLFDCYGLLCYIRYYIV